MRWLPSTVRPRPRTEGRRGCGHSLHKLLSICRRHPRGRGVRPVGVGLHDVRRGRSSTTGIEARVRDPALRRSGNRTRVGAGTVGIRISVHTTQSETPVRIVSSVAWSGGDERAPPEVLVRRHRAVGPDRESDRRIVVTVPSESATGRAAAAPCSRADRSLRGDAEHRGQMPPVVQLVDEHAEIDRHARRPPRRPSDRSVLRSGGVAQETRGDVAPMIAVNRRSTWQRLQLSLVHASRCARRPTSRRKSASRFPASTNARVATV